MKVEKITMDIRVEVLSLDTIPSLLTELSLSIANRENVRGSLTKDDGDTITWDFTRANKTI